MSTGGPLVCLFGPYFFQNEYSKPLPGPKFEYWPFETIPLDIIMRVGVKSPAFKGQQKIRDQLETTPACVRNFWLLSDFLMGERAFLTFSEALVTAFFNCWAFFTATALSGGPFRPFVLEVPFLLVALSSIFFALFFFLVGSLGAGSCGSSVSVPDDSATLLRAVSMKTFSGITLTLLAWLPFRLPLVVPGGPLITH